MKACSFLHLSSDLERVVKLVFEGGNESLIFPLVESYPRPADVQWRVTGVGCEKGYVGGWDWGNMSAKAELWRRAFASIRS